MTVHAQGEVPACWEVLDDRLLNACCVWDLRERRYRHPKTGKEGDFYYIDSRDWVIVVARTVEGELLLIRQFRWGANELSWELPGGIIDAGEDPVKAGLRELQEETGYVAKTGRLIGHARPNPAILNNFCHVVLAEEVVLDVSGTDWDEHEEIEVCVLPEATVMQWVRECKIGHALALNGLLFYQLDQNRIDAEA
ncbi:NUDIX hydrolase [Coraliomargarita sp. SDUM461004]|uniref:GDP-mannose pyrophosphatase n=1 Tax=Thalassobacterium sedimentorum TaxID=3041258 RepID=A0ABU1AKB1_9BACT|nr:NUDIX hydrolase [Coraliomargarita sp. SDUM461004]MDQ8194613.1 NUDIX hydrolase [Coraliomargarita sp. SDUM461004]